MRLIPEGLKWTGGRQVGGYRKFLVAQGGTWDFWVLHFPRGSSIGPHRDGVAAGQEHHRVNVVIWQPRRGGRYLGEAIFRLGRLVYFRPDVMEHAVSICGGPRVVLSVGWLQNRKDG